MSRIGLLALLLVVVVLAAAAYGQDTTGGAVSANDEGGYKDPEAPNTLESVTGSRIAAYVFFFILASFVLLMVYRGVKAR
jgi:hypothetical protein